MLDIRIDGLGSGGDGVGRLEDGRVVFVPRALPGDTVRIDLGQVRKRLQYGELVQLLQASPERVESRCKITQCGGCPTRGLSLAAQGRWKRQRIVDNLRRIAHLDVGDKLGALWQFGDGWRYRHRVRLHAEWVRNRWRLGYFRSRSRQLVPLSHCPVLWHELEQAALGLDHALSALPREAALSQVELAYSRCDGRAAARLVGFGPVAQYRAHVDAVLSAGMSGVEIQGEGGRFREGNLELRYDHARLKEYSLRYEPSTFTQAHPLGNQRLVDSVLAHVAPQHGPRVLELHSGIGNFSIPLRRAGARVIAVEKSSRASILSRRNAASAGVEVEVVEATDIEAVERASEVDCVLLDPPRIGAKNVCSALAAARPPRIVYVSCDTATLARDAAILAAAGYRIVAAEGFDMFPQTAHVETLLSFER